MGATERLAKAQSTTVESVKKQSNGLGGLQLTPELQKKLVAVAVAIAKGVLVFVDPYKIRPMHGQPRDYFPTEEQESLGGSLGLIGQIQDIIIRKKLPPSSHAANAPDFESEERVWRIADTEYEICDGERRWRGSMEKGLLEVRAKLIEVDDEGAYLVAVVSNLNRVGHTTLERARSIQRLMKGDPPCPIEIIATMQGISVSTARKLLDTLNLPPDIHDLMNPVTQRERGQEILGKVPSYELARLAGNPALHDSARELARRYVQREIKVPELRAEVDRVLSRSGAARNVLAERHQPARRISNARDRLMLALEKGRESFGLLKDLREEKLLPPHDIGFGSLFNSLIDLGEEGLGIVGSERRSRKKQSLYGLHAEKADGSPPSAFYLFNLGDF